MCFSALETADPMPPPRAKMSTFPCKRKHKECYMCNVCDKCCTSLERLTRHIAKHFAGLSSTSAQLAAARMHLPTPTSDQLQAAGLSVSVSQPQGFMLNSNTTTTTPADAGPDAARPGLACHTTSPRQSTPVPSPPTKKGKSVYFLLCYFSFWEMSPISHRNESHFPLFNEK